MKKAVKFLLLALVLSGGGYGALRFFSPAETRYVYKTQSVTRGAITSSISATGKVNAMEMVEVGTQVSGTIKEMHADFNSPVTKGQLLAVLDPDVLTSRVEESKASLAVAQAGAAKARAEVDNAQRAAKRSRELWERKLIARRELDTAETQLTVARASLTEANSRVIQAKESLRQAETNLGYTKIFSPIDGVVISRQVDVGQTVAASLQAPTLFSIAKDLTQMQVEANIDEADIGRIKEGQKAVCKFDSWPEDAFEAVVFQKRLNPETISNVVTYVVILKVNNEENKLMPGMTANVSVVTERRDDVLKVPAAALRFAPPAEAVAALGEVRTERAEVVQGRGLLPIPQRGSRSSRNRDSAAAPPPTQTVWLVEDEQLVGSLAVETGVSDRTWVELRGDALSFIREGQKLAVAFTKETAGSASAGTK
ncbi:MAG: efflux RND transporter periplasmic adaptor subunit [Synergistaceae bacterium]|jgi:HlyD family secretion protein|nr:efflux RND transporter periplasmic adaptor subunit [Synergistaceae bacterium]